MSDDNRTLMFIPEQPQAQDSRSRKRFKESCDYCGAAKVKCSKEKPVCARCDARGLPCYYSPAQRHSKRARTGLDSSICLDTDLFGTFPMSDHHGFDDFFDFEIDYDHFISNPQTHPDKPLLPPFRNSFAREANLIDTFAFSSVPDDDSYASILTCEGAAAVGLTTAQQSSSVQKNRMEMANHRRGERTPIPQSLEGIDDLLRRTERLEGVAQLPECLASCPASTKAPRLSPVTPFHINLESGNKSGCNQLLLSIQRNLSTSTSQHTTCPKAILPINDQITLSTQKAEESRNHTTTTILALHSTLTNRLRHVLSCICCKDVDVQLLLGVVFRQMLSWYRSLMNSSSHHEKISIDPQHVLLPTSDTCLTSQSNTVHSSGDTLLGIICTESEDVPSNQPQLVLRLLQDIARLIKDFAEICESASNDLGEALVAFLKRELKNITKGVVAIL